MKKETVGHKAALEFISSINAVEGFDPVVVTKEVASLEKPGEKEQFLPLIWKKAWARKVYPLHRCHAGITEMKDDMVAAYAVFYVDNDREKEAIGEGFAFVSIDLFAADSVKAKSDAILKALGSAKSRAYTDAGFGLQFWIDDCIDDLLAASNQQLSGKMPLLLSQEDGEDVTVKTGCSLSALVELSEDPSGTQQQLSVRLEEGDSSTVADEEAENSQMTVFMMSVENAKNVISSCGCYSGRTMGQLYENKVTRQLFPKLFERTDDKTERLAIKTLIESDPELVSYCRRNGKVLDD